MIENLEELARDECARSSFGLAFFDEHLAIVAHYANRLVSRQADKPRNIG